MRVNKVTIPSRRAWSDFNIPLVKETVVVVAAEVLVDVEEGLESNAEVAAAVVAA